MNESLNNLVHRFVRTLIHLASRHNSWLFSFWC